MDRIAYFILPLVAGALIAAQAPINARLRVTTGSPVASATISFLVGSVILVAATLAMGQGAALVNLGGGPWWAYLGGACGAVFVFATLVAAPRVGVLGTFVAVVLGQVALSALIDRFGWFGQPSISFGWDRVAAIVLLLAALVLLLRRV
jgi:bacterial/archaeal transporter family-2 protein